MLKNTIADKYWENKLQEQIPLISLYRLRFDHTVTYKHIKVNLSPIAVERINQITGKSKVAQYIYLLSAFAIVLNKYSDNSESPVITTGSFHIEPGDEPVKNILFLKTGLSPELTIKELLNNLRQTVIEAYKYQEYSFDAVLSQAKDNGTDSASLFQFGFFDSDISFISKEITDKLPLWIELFSDNAGISFILHYDSSFDSTFINHLTAHYAGLASVLIDNLTVPIGELNLLTKNEKENMLKEYSADSVTKTAVESLVTSFNDLVKKRKESAAVCFRGKLLSYELLDQYSDSIALHLNKKYNVSTGSIVAVSLSSSVEFLASVLAILKCGATVLPIDISLPQLRAEYYIKDSRASVLLSEGKWDDSICMHNLKHETLSILMNDKKDFVSPEISSSDIAYIIYTSGSTGNSKAVRITHENILKQFQWFKDHFSFEPDDVLPQKTTIGFVDSILELLFPVTIGESTVYLRPENEVIQDIPKFTEWLTEIKPTIIQFVPSVFDFIQTVTDLSQIKSLRILILTGEELKRTYQLPFLVYNVYGSSECTAYSLVYQLNGNEKGRIPIGRPVANTNVYILSEDHKIQPLFIAGEIYIGGDTVAAGYLNREDLTSERFIADPFVPLKRMYKTGDYGRYLPNGIIEYLGRKDNQLKIRGQRIEPGEIEFKIKAHAAISEAVVWSSKDKSGESMLSAFFTLKQDKAFTIQKSSQLQKQNPDLFKEFYYLPNKLLIYPLNKRESELLYNEIFIDNSYIRNGIQINDNDIIFDIGANIGLFSLYIGLNYKSIKLFAFEPLPPIFEALKTNISLYNIDTTLFNFGLAEREAEVKFSYYANNTALSGRYASEGVEKDVVRNYIKNDTGKEQQHFTDQELDEVVNERIKYTNYDCRIRRLSDVIRENDIQRINLLKIDVEKSELDVLNGIDAEHWSLIQQIVIEIHDIESRGDQIVSMLKSKGFSVVVEQEALFQNTDILNVYAIRTPGNESNPPELLRCNKSGLWTDAEALIEQISALCKSDLPGYMVPSRFKILEDFPRLSNGKIDRKILEGINIDSFLKSKDILLPRNHTEKIILKIFSEVLKKDNIGVDEDFFKNGGHSLNATLLTTKIAKELEVKISLKDIFDNPTVEGLSLFLGKHEANVSEEIPALAYTDDYPVSFNQKRLWLSSQLDDNNIAYNISGAYLLEGNLDKRGVEKAFEILIERHEILRTIFINKDGIPFQKIVNSQALGFKIKFEDIQEQQNKNKAAAAIIERIKSVPFDLTLPPLLKVSCIQVAPQKHLVALTIHHIISDAWSIKNMIHEVLESYEQYSAGSNNTANNNKPLAIQYKDYSTWHNNIVNSGKLLDQKKFWINKLEGKTEPIQLPYDNLPGKNPVSGNSFSFILEGSNFDSVIALCEQLKITPFVALLGAYKILLNVESRQQNIIIGIPASGREHKDLDNQLGFYINLIPLLTAISGNLSYRQLLYSLRESTIEAQQNQLFPIDLVMEELNFKRQAGRSGFINTGFTWNVNESERVVSNTFKIKPFPVPASSVHHEFWLIGELYPSYIQFKIEYRSDLFNRATIALFAEKYLSLLKQLVNAPELSIDKHDPGRYAEHLLKENEMHIDIDI